jgi:hypothetical protein
MQRFLEVDTDDVQEPGFSARVERRVLDLEKRVGRITACRVHLRRDSKDSMSCVRVVDIEISRRGADRVDHATGTGPDVSKAIAAAFAAMRRGIIRV